MSLNMPYCACFSDDGDLLSQWGMYADNGTGISIGFDFDYFQIKNEPPHPNTNVKNSIGLEAVIYDYDVQASILYQIITENLDKTPNASYPLKISVNLTRCSAIFKNRTFYAEREKRIIYYFAEQHISQFNENFLSGPYEYKKHEGVEYSRFEISWFNVSDNHAISKIFLGPKCKKSSLEIVQIFEKFGVNISESQISKSESSYR